MVRSVFERRRLSLRGDLGEHVSWEDVENAVQAAVVAASGMDQDKVTWSYQNVNEPELDHVTISFGGEIMIGVDHIKTTYDATRPNGQEIKQEIQGVREVSLEIACFTTTTSGSAAARRLLELTRTRLRLDTIRYGLKQAGLSVFDPGPVNWIPDIPSARFRGRAVCSIRCYLPVTDCLEYVGYIARIRGTFFPIGWHGGPGGASGIAFDSAAGGVDSSLIAVYYDMAVPATITEAFIKALSGTSNEAHFARTISFTGATGTKKGYYAFPTSFGTPTLFRDNLTGLEIPNTLVVTGVIVTDAYGVSRSYDAWATVDLPAYNFSEQVT